MASNSPTARHFFACLLATAIVSSTALANKPDWAGGGNEQGGKGQSGKEQGAKGQSGKEQRSKEGNGNSAQRSGDRQVVERRAANGRTTERYFDDQRRIVVGEYYDEQFRNGRCPPGLSKKNNGCMPPGQAKKWSVGRPLPRDVIFYDVPQQLVVRLGAPPSGHRYVRVAGDLLMIAIGTSMVVDAIENLGRM